MESKRSDAARAEELKGLANNSFRCHKYVPAIELYTRAIELDGHNPVYWINRAYARIKLEEYASAVQDASKATNLTAHIARVTTCAGWPISPSGSTEKRSGIFSRLRKFVPSIWMPAKRVKECENGLMQLQGAIILPEPKPTPSTNHRGAIILPEPTPAAKLKGAIVLPEPRRR